MIPLTTLADFHRRLAKDSRYQLVLISAFKRYYGDNTPPRKSANDWLEEWESEINKTNYNTCKIMIAMLNHQLDQLPMIFNNKLFSAHKINTF